VIAVLAFGDFQSGRPIPWLIYGPLGILALIGLLVPPRGGGTCST
jgi:hypothetical protein